MTIEQQLHKSFQQQLKHLNKSKPSQEEVAAVLGEWGYKKVTLEDIKSYMTENKRMP